MIAGSVTQDGIPFIRVKIGGDLRRAVIDTGFNGDLELPESLRGEVNAEFVFRASSLLAGGVLIDEDVFRVEFPFDGHVVEAEATFVDDQDILIGTRLLRNYRLTINFKSRTVRIQDLK